MKSIQFFAPAVFSLLCLAGCSSQRPVLYPNDNLKRAGSAAADRDINECMHRAEAYVSSGGGGSRAMENTAIDSGTSAAIGAAAGAAGGSIVGHAATGAAIGAAGGSAAGLTRGLIGGLTTKQNPSPVYKSFVDRCLREKGYDPIGWQ